MPVCYLARSVASAIDNGDVDAESFVNKSPRKPRRKSPQSRIPEAFQTIGASANDVPKLVLQGEWLKAVGFPVGSAAVLTTDRLGEMTLHRLGLSVPRRVRITRA